MEKVVSKDGTTIAFDRSGEGRAVILVAGASGIRSHPMMTQLAQHLASHFTVYNYDRRGRGDSDDTQPYAVEREIEDIEALIDDADGSAYLYGISSGAALALETANKIPTKVKKLAMYEPPYIVDDSRPPLPNDYVSHLNDLVAEGRRGEAAEYFLTVAIGLPADFIAPMRNGSDWAELESVAHTLAYDGAVVDDYMHGKPLPPNQWASATMPTLVMDGGESPAFFHHTAQALVDLLPNARRRTLQGQSHGVDSEVLAPVLVEFFED